MTDEQHAFWESYMRSLADRLGLRDWRFHFDDQACDDDSAASISCLYGRKSATVRLAREWETHSPEWQRQTLVHEALHCHAKGVQNAADATIAPLGSVAYAVFSSVHEQAIEYMVDAIAEAIAPLMPLPEERP